MAAQQERVRVVDFYNEAVLPSLMQRLDQAFPEFGWRRDARGWVATNQQYTHDRLGVRAGRVVAHDPKGFLVYGGDPMLWTAYVNDGTVPRGAEFVRVVTDLAARAGVDPSPIRRDGPADRRAELLEAFFDLARRELTTERGASARSYLERRDFPPNAIGECGLGVVPPASATRLALKDRGFRDAEIKAAAILADSRWPGRLCGAWRNDWGTIGTFWARAVDDGGPVDTRYLYLRGASRTTLPPYGLPARAREIVLVEGFLDHHQLTARGIDDVAALGGHSTSPRLFERLSRRGIQSVVLCLDNDAAGRTATIRAIEHAARAPSAPVLYVIPPEQLGEADDPDTLVRRNGIESWKQLLEHRECAVVWRAKEMVGDVEANGRIADRRAALANAGTWLGKLSPRLALEVDDAIRAVSERSGYDPVAVSRAFRARFWGARPVQEERERALDPTRKLDHSIDL